jgi:membrane-bound lytic murein transglycosylase A
MFKNLPIFFLLITTVAFFGCYPTLEKKAERPGEALNRIRFFYPKFRDDMDLPSLAEALGRNLEYLDRLDSEYVFTYGRHKFTSRQVRDSQKALLNFISKNPDPRALNKEIRKNYQIYRAAGRVGRRRVLFTGYFEPIYEGSLKADETFRYPLYKRPDDLLRIDLSLFSKELKGKRIVARIEGTKVLPYFSRQQIEVERALEGRNLEIAWLKDPVDVAFLHIQGSGRIRLPDGKMISVGYQTSNGRPYRSIGRYLLDRGVIDRKKMSMQAIRQYLAQNSEIADEVLNHNPSYIFFEAKENGPFGNINVPLTPGRSIALDSRLFPKGALCYISSKKPVVNSRGQITGWTDFSRLVVNQDTGGAIRGAGRADVFWGSNEYAQLAAGHMKHEGELYVLIKKPGK